VAANSKWWDTLPKDIQDIVLNEVGPKITKEATEGVMAYSDAALKELVEEHGGTISTLSDAELKKLIEIEKTQVWPKIAENIDPALYEAAKKCRASIKPRGIHQNGESTKDVSEDH
jgi:TRAP-type C4-dicarboxylate transport system substrate-binding protein